MRDVSEFKRYQERLTNFAFCSTDRGREYSTMSPLEQYGETRPTSPGCWPSPASITSEILHTPSRGRIFGCFNLDHTPISLFRRLTSHRQPIKTCIVKAIRDKKRTRMVLSSRSDPPKAPIPPIFDISRLTTTWRVFFQMD